MRPELFANSELFAVLMPSLQPMPIEVAAGIWLAFILSLCALLSGARGPTRWIGRGLLVAIMLAAIVVLGSTAYAFLLFPAVYWGCGWCWIW